MSVGIWLSFADKSRPRGEMFVGVVIVQARSNNAAVARVVELGLWPKTDVVTGRNLDVVMYPVDVTGYAMYLDRLLDEEEAAFLGERCTVRRPI